MHSSVNRVLSRHILRSLRGLEKGLLPLQHPIFHAHCATCLDLESSNYRDLLRRGNDDPDFGFQALKVLQWLDNTLADHRRLILASTGTVELGLQVIAELAGPSSLSTEECSESIDEIAAEAEAIIDLGVSEKGNSWLEAAPRLRRLEALSDVMFQKHGWKGQPAILGADIVSASSLPTVLVSKSGLPLLMCGVYAAAGQRLGLPLSFTNFPFHVILRLERKEFQSHEQHASSELVVGSYGPHGQEILELSTRCTTEDTVELVATKITGDPFVPAGEVSFTALLPTSVHSCVENCGILSLGPMSLSAQIHVSSSTMQHLQRIIYDTFSPHIFRRLPT